MANAGMVPMPINPGSCWRNPLKCVRRIACSVVHAWPSGFTYCRSSWQIVQCAGGASLSGYCVPQVVQMNAGMIASDPGSTVRRQRATVAAIVEIPAPLPHG